MGTGQGIQSGVTTVQIDNQQQTFSPKKDVQGWWNAFTAEDVDRLLELGNWGRWNAYTAEDVDRMLQLGPFRRRSLRRGSYERRYIMWFLHLTLLALHLARKREGTQWWW